MGPFAEQANSGPSINNRRVRHEHMDNVAAVLSTLDGQQVEQVLELASRLRGSGHAIDKDSYVAGGALTGPEQAKTAYRGDPFVVSMENLDQAMRYQPWMPNQVEQGDRIREVLTSTARVFLRELPDNPLRRRLLEEVLQLRMLANMAISFPYGFGR